jgi:Holliday junction DNA helicase RuvA
VIASLSGKVIALETGSAIIDVSGVGYLVSLTAPTVNKIALDSTVRIFTTMIVREDGFSLYGFLSTVDQKIFDLLRSVTGVGPKSALGILSAMNSDEIINAVAAENDLAFKQVSGVGPKTAKLIVLTLAGRLGVGASVSSTPKQSEVALVVSALTGLGWSERIALDVAQQAQSSLGVKGSTNELLKEALSRLGSSKSIGAGDE